MCLLKEKGKMGFRDLKSFNKAFLVKQGWILPTNPNSLFSRVFKAKCFLDCDFVLATLDNHPLYAWRSIMSAQAVVEKGMRWRVGNGDSIHICTNKWLPSTSYTRVLSLVQVLRENAKLSELIIKEMGEWKSDLVRQLF